MGAPQGWDPIFCTEEESARMVDGYLDGYAKRPPRSDDYAYLHGHMNGRHDAWGRSSEYGAANARRLLDSLKKPAKK